MQQPKLLTILCVCGAATFSQGQLWGKEGGSLLMQESAHPKVYDEIMDGVSNYDELERQASTLKDGEFADYFLRGDLGKSVTDNTQVQTIFVDGAVHDRGTCLEVLKRLVAKRQYNEVTKQLLAQSEAYLDAPIMFQLTDMALKTGNGKMVSYLREAILQSEVRHPEQFAMALGLGAVRDQWDYVLALWRRAPAAWRTPKLSSALIEVASQRRATADIKKILKVESRYETNPFLSAEAKRFAVAYLKGEPMAESLYSVFCESLDPDQLAQAQLLRTAMVLDLAATLRHVIEDPANPFFLQQHADALEAHLVSQLRRGELAFDLSTVEQAARQWIEHYKQAGVPPTMRTHH